MASPEKLPYIEPTNQPSITINHSDDISAVADTHSASELRPDPEKVSSTPERDAEAGNKSQEPRPVPVPRWKRRGLFGSLTLISEVDNPRAYPRSTKWILTCTVSLATLIAPMGTSIFYPALREVESDLHTNATVTNLSLAFYLLAMAIFPLWWSNWAEAFGRRTIYLISFALGVVFAVLAAISNSIGMLVAVRLLSGGSSASVQAVGVASISDLWEPRERGRAMGISFLVHNPFSALLVLRYPAMFLPMFYIGIVTIYFYVLNISIQNTFANPPYNFSTLIVGLLYIPSSLGYICGSIIGGRWMDYVMQREARKANRFDANGKPRVYPEERMKENTWVGALLPVAALLWYGWTAEHGVYWLCPMIANFFTGFGMIIIISVGITMISEFMPGDSRGLAASVFIRNVLGCVGTVVAAPMLSTLGNGWTFTLWAFVALASSLVIVAVTKYGPRWRESMVASGAVRSF
uniref:Quinidine resistance protein 3 n=1 Tax=Talaromyces marneffei PM1 TaxID=1077442 RepID=A0A093VJ17_TALMA